MATDKNIKLESLLREVFRQATYESLSQAKLKAIVVPGFEIPRAGSVELFLGPKSGTTMAIAQRSDFIGAYRHTIGQIIGILAHYHQMQEREIRESLRNALSHPESSTLMQPDLDVLKVAKRMIVDRKAGDIKIALVTEFPEVPQQAKELVANFFPVAKMLEVWLPTLINKQKICQSVSFFVVTTNTTPPVIKPLYEALEEQNG